ncbi:unnamed protein product, partial [Staurois parvus]
AGTQPDASLQPDAGTQPDASLQPDAGQLTRCPLLIQMIRYLIRCPAVEPNDPMPGDPVPAVIPGDPMPLLSSQTIRYLMTRPLPCQMTRCPLSSQMT